MSREKRRGYRMTFFSGRLLWTSPLTRNSTLQMCPVFRRRRSKRLQVVTQLLYYDFEGLPFNTVEGATVVCGQPKEAEPLDCQVDVH